MLEARRHPAVRVAVVAAAVWLLALVAVYADYRFDVLRGFSWHPFPSIWHRAGVAVHYAALLLTCVASAVAIRRRGAHAPSDLPVVVPLVALVVSVIVTLTLVFD